MKFTQTFFTQTKDLRFLNGGWLSPKYHLMSWALSSSLIKKNHPNNQLELVTDSFGKNILIDELNLPYDSVNVALDDLDFEVSSDLWVLKKMFVHTLHEEPFLYLDSDVFIFGKLDEVLLQSDLIAQNKEINFNIYFPFVKKVLDDFDYPIEETSKYYRENKSWIACNKGITGGQNFNFFKAFFNFVLDFIKKNELHFKFLPSVFLNTSIEQFLFYQFAQSRNQEISYLLNKRFQPNYLGLNNFHEVPDRRSYLHLVMNNKRIHHNCEQLEKRLSYDFPKVYQKINDFFESKKTIKIPSKRNDDFYRTKLAIEKNVSIKKPNYIGRIETEKIEFVESDIIRLYEYEKEIAFIYKKLNTNNLINRNQLMEFEEVFLSNQDLTAFDVTLNPNVKRVKIDRKWVQKNDLNICIQFRETYEMFTKNNELDDVLLNYHPEQKLVGEYILLSEKLIFDWLERTNKINLHDLYDLIDDYCEATYKFYVKEILHEKIRFFIFQNILLITPTSDKML